MNQRERGRIFTAVVIAITFVVIAIARFLY